MELSIIFKGLLIGFTGAAVLGPIGVIIIERVLKKKWQSGLASGAGVAIADGIFGLMGGLGLTVITSFMVGQQNWLRLIGGGILLIMGISTIVKKEKYKFNKDKKNSKFDYLKDFSSIFILTVSNPMTILYFASVYTGIGLLEMGNSWTGAIYFAVGVTLGSLIWWIILVGIVNHLRSKFNPQYLKMFSKLSGTIIALFGISILFSLL